MQTTASESLLVSKSYNCLTIVIGQPGNRRNWFGKNGPLYKTQLPRPNKHFSEERPNLRNGEKVTRLF